MKVHANAALGPAGRLALAKQIESGATMRAAAASRRRPRTAGGTATGRPAMPSAAAKAGCVTAPAARIISHGG